MAEEKMPWFLANDDESDTEEEKHPQFNADEMEFESFMFDMGQGPALRQSGPLGSTGTAVAEPPAQAQSSPFTGSEVPRRNSGPLLPRSSGPLLKPSGPLTPRSSGPLVRQSGPLFEADAPASMDDAFPPMATGATPTTGGLEPVPQPAPLRGSGPLVDGRTSTGPLPVTSTSSPRLSSADLPGASDLAQHSTNPFVSASAQRTSSPLASGGLGEQPAPARPVKATAELPPLPGAQSPSSSTDPFTFGQQQEVVTATQEYATFDEGTSGAPMSSMSGMEAPVNVVGGWTDSALASVEDFSAVLFALDGGLQPTAASLADSE